MRGRLLRGTLAAVTVLAACRTSPDPRTIPQSTSPNGEEITLTLATGRIVRGELLAVTDTSWILLIGQRIAFARVGGIGAVRVGSADLSYSDGVAPSTKALAGARHAARFPYGIAPDVMRMLLAKAAQSEPDDLAALPR